METVDVLKIKHILLFWCMIILLNMQDDLMNTGRGLTTVAEDVRRCGENTEGNVVFCHFP